jgi:hypothetical protein
MFLAQVSHIHFTADTITVVVSKRIIGYSNKYITLILKF